MVVGGEGCGGKAGGYLQRSKCMAPRGGLLGVLQVPV
jgi:hypothetical protein